MTSLVHGVHELARDLLGLGLSCRDITATSAYKTLSKGNMADLDGSTEGSKREQGCK